MGNATWKKNWSPPPPPDPAGPDHWLLQAQLDRTTKPTGTRFHAKTRWSATYKHTPPTPFVRVALEKLIERQKALTTNPPPHFTRTEWERAMETLDELEGQHDAMGEEG